jgi:hypothetical protein
VGFRLALMLLALLAPRVAGAEAFVWVDDEGVTHLTDDPESVPEHARERLLPEGSELAELWRDGLLGPPSPEPAAGGLEEARLDRLFHGALADLRRGETARASVGLESVLRERPAAPEPHFILAILDRRRGRFDSAEAHLRAFLAAAGDRLEPWRRSALRQLASLDDERRLADSERAAGPVRWSHTEAEHFRLVYDAELGAGGDGFAPTVLRYLAEAREQGEALLGVVPAEATTAVLYGKAAYQREHAGRFSFATVGFYDGRIHVVSAAHPAGELRALLFHEYVHALFREHTGGDRPYWLNEGLAELAERTSRGRPALTRGELLLLHQRIEAGRWIPLARLAPSFSGLGDEDARVAYLESAAAAAWIVARTDRGQRARLLGRIARGESADAALLGVLGLDGDALGAALREQVRASFP